MSKKKSHLASQFYTFDIETTSYITGIHKDTGDLKKEGILYSAQFFDGSEYTQVRTLAECIGFLKKLEETASPEEKTCIFVHNLQFEFQFIKNFFQWQKILANSPRRIISIETDTLVFRCSYMLSNMSLDKFLQSEEVESSFLKTTLDYNKERFPWTNLTKKEKTYMRNDVVGLHKAIINMMVKNGINSLDKLPLTNTGFVRTECRKNMQKNYKNRYWFKDSTMNLETFDMCHDAFRGGNTHYNRFHGKKILYDVSNVDIASSYPFQLLTKKYPGKFYDLKKVGQKELLRYLQNGDKYALLIRCSFEDITIKDGVTIPYIPIAKCSNVSEVENDNGRILTAAHITITITEVDFKIILDQYKFSNLKIHKIKIAKKKPIPIEMKKTIEDYYYKKCTLKNVDDYYYMKSKNRLNSLYGMSVTNPIKCDYEYKDGHIIEKDFDKSEKLDDYNESWSSFIPYQVGVWVTAYARRQLQDVINIVGADMVYCDTDSVKYLHGERYKKSIEKYNEKIIDNNKKKNLTVYYNGKYFNIGIFEFEEKYRRFRSFGAKKYLAEYFIEKNGIRFLQQSITIAGVPKKAGIEDIRQKIANKYIKDFFDIDIGYTFRNIKNTVEFNDYTDVKTLVIDGHTVEYSSNCAFYDCDYTLGFSNEYEILLRLMNEFK